MDKAGGLIGAAGGVIRAAASLAPILIASEDKRTWLYVTVDVCLTVGLLSLYFSRRRRMQPIGTLGTFLALGGLVTGRIVPLITDRNMYPVTAAAVAIGLLMLAVSEWQMRRMSPLIPMAFALSLAAGSIATFVAAANAFLILSGILFGCAFAAMAIEVVQMDRRDNRRIVQKDATASFKN